jgi:hypothetical protein
VFEYALTAVRRAAMWMRIRFPKSARYGDSLGRFRARLKPLFPGLQIRRCSEGATVTGPPETVPSVLLVLPDGFELVESAEMGDEMNSGYNGSAEKFDR